MVAFQFNILKCSNIGEVCPVKEHEGQEGDQQNS
jgi:hypothetical protein